MSGEGSSSGPHRIPYNTEMFSLFRALSLRKMEKKGLDWSREKREYVTRERFPGWVERQRKRLEDLGVSNTPINVSESRSLVELGDLASSSGRVDRVSGEQTVGSSNDGVVGVPDAIYVAPVALAMPHDNVSDFERRRRDESLGERRRVEKLVQCQVSVHELAEMNIKVKTEEEVIENLEDCNRLYRELGIPARFYLPNSRYDLAALEESKWEVEGENSEGDQSFMHQKSLG